MEMNSIFGFEHAVGECAFDGHGDAFVSLIDNSQLHIIDGGGHLSHLERPEEFACVVKEFLL